MSEVDRLFEQYRHEHREGGEAHPWDFLERLEGTDREELAALIDSYLARAPGSEWDPEAFKGSPAEQLSESLTRSLQSEAGLWPALLPRLRERAKVNRTELVKRMAGALGLAGREEKIGVYYHEMEQGLLPSKGVSDKVLTALGEIVGVGAERLRRAGESIGGGPPPDTAVTYARTAAPAPEFSDADEAAPPPVAMRTDERVEEEWDEVDQLFHGG